MNLNLNIFDAIISKTVFHEYVNRSKEERLPWRHPELLLLRQSPPLLKSPTSTCDVYATAPPISISFEIFKVQQPPLPIK